MAAQANGRARRRLRRREARLSKRIVRSPLTEADIPPGSKLSAATAEAIRRGEYAFATYVPPQLSPVRSQTSRLKRRRQMRKESRRRNR